MRRTKSRRLLWHMLLAVLALALVAAACGDDDDDAASPEPAAEPEPEPAAATEPEPEPAAATEPEPEPAAEPEPEPDPEPAAEPEPDPEPAVDAAAERCEANRAAGTMTFVTGFDFAAAAGIIDAIVAEAQGYFDELCIDFEIQPGFAPSNGALVIEGQAQFGASGSFAELVNNNVAGEGDLVALLHWGRTAIEAIVLPEGSPITDFAGLCGSLVGIKGDLPYSLQASVALSGVERSCFDEVLLDGFDPVAHLDLGIDALPVYKSNEPNTLTNNGVPFTMLDPLDFDVPSSFGVTFTTQSMIDSNPDLVADVVRALIRGQAFAAANPDVAIENAFELIDAAGNPLYFAMEAERYRWGVESGLIADLAPPGVGVGIPDLGLFEAEIDALVEAGVFETAPDWQSMVDTGIATSVYDGTTLVWPGP
ncbi:MAG: ABC transporter substrate-binding protein [Acidimicrobiaceae bacterium]|nr:ABC transporter substrate-binding protein [Acidimicrobiaceae bacterium]MDE0163436.1 ABC transporter substrate-binding protein [Acidimicrobiaceae bacterium]